MTYQEIMDLSPANQDNYNALLEAIHNNTVVPFIGAGISVPFFPLWDEALIKLQEKTAPDRHELVERDLSSVSTEIDKCSVLEKHLGKRQLCRALCELFSSTSFSNSKDQKINTGARAILPLLFPKSPLLTTNLDRMLEEVFRNNSAPFNTVMSPRDTELLSILNQKRAHGILYLHGFVSGELTKYEDLVFSKSQYDNHYSENSPLVKALQSWIEGTQLLFLGCSLRNDRTLDILQKLYKGNKRLEHFAILDLKDCDQDVTSRMIQLEEDYGIRAILYPNGQHNAVEVLLNRLYQDTIDNHFNYVSGIDRTVLEKTQYVGTSLFLGREKIVEKVVSGIKNPSIPILLVQGVAGIGKTEICKAAYRKVKEETSDFEMPFLDLSDVNDVLTFCRRLADECGISLKFDTQKDAIEKLISALAQKCKDIVIRVYLDNFEDLWIPLEQEARDDLADLLKRLGTVGLKFLISSQETLVFAETITVGPLDEKVNNLKTLAWEKLISLDRAKLFIKTLGRNPRPTEKKAFYALLEETGGHPLSIVLAASYGKECGTLVDLLSSWHSIEQHYDGERKSHNSLSYAMGLTWESIVKCRAAVLRWALHANSSSPIDHVTFAELREKLPEKFTNSQWIEGQRHLHKLGLITIDDDEAESMLLCVKKVFPSLSQEAADANEIAYKAWNEWNKQQIRNDDSINRTNSSSILSWLRQFLHLADIGMSRINNDNFASSKHGPEDMSDFLPDQSICDDITEAFNYIHGRTILVTGAGGSIGSELCRQIAAHNPKQLIIFDVYENNAYDIQMELREKYSGLDLVTLIGSVQDSRRMFEIFSKYRPEIVYHAAAYKHVPLMENSPCEAVKNNANGTYKTAYAAMVHGCQRFVLVSTDKAVNPTNIMGASVRLSEMIIQSFDAKIKAGKANEIPQLFTYVRNETADKDYSNSAFQNIKTEFAAVRFGNVLGSNGSVIPIFKKQIENGGPVTVTHPDIIRFFMTIHEAVSLVMIAGGYAHGGEIFVLDMGTPVKIDTLARDLIKQAGYKPDVDIKIVYTGLRPGEKLYEEKLMAEENLKVTENKRIFIGSPIEFNINQFLEKLQVLMEAAYNNDNIKQLVAEIVTSYHPSSF